jgi:excisionase family DNA binding protein
VSDRQQTIEPLMCSIQDAARAIGISRSFFYQLLSSGELPVKVIRLGRRSLVSFAELRNYVQEQEKARR